MGRGWRDLHWKEAEWCVGQEDHSTEREMVDAEGRVSQGQEGLEVREGSDLQGKPGGRHWTNGESETWGEMAARPHSQGREPGFEFGPPRTWWGSGSVTLQGSPTLFSKWSLLASGSD